MKPYSSTRSAIQSVLAAALLAGAGQAAHAGFLTAVFPYAVPTTSDYTIVPLLSVADAVPETSHPFLNYRMIGIPDGLGACKNSDGTITLFMNHEVGNTVVSETVVGVETNRGAFVSHFVLDADGSILSGERAYDTVFMENTLVGPAPETGNATRGIARLCSGSLIGPGQGFDDYIYLAGEESAGSATFDGTGGLCFAITGNEAHALPKLGRFNWENALAMQFPGNKTVIMCMEDGPVYESQLYMYVGQKDPSPGASVLRRNGLDNGALYVFVSDTAGVTNEIDFQNGSIVGHWVEIPNAGSMTDVQLEAASDAAGAFSFARPEDGAFNKNSRKDFYFVTTGGGTSNQLGRLYHVHLNPGGDVTEPVTLTVVYNADQVVAAGGDTALSPDNLDVSENYLMINEDGTTQSRAVMASKNRDGGIWRFDIDKKGRVNASSATFIAELNPPGRDGVPVGPGVWETSGIIDSSSLFGTEAWLFDVQAHPPTSAPAPRTVEDGQLLLMFRNP